MKYILGVDLGTSGTKTVLFNEEGAVIASSAVEYMLYQPQNGWAEQNPNDWWNAAADTIKSVILKSGVDVNSIAGIGVSGQMHGLVALDEKGEVLRNAIIWCDGRTTDECAYITEKVGAERLIEISANPALTGFTAGKILWVRNNEPELYKKCRHFLLPKDFVNYKLTGVLSSEVSDASGTNLFDVANRKWSEEIADKLEIDMNMLAPMHESCDVIGTVSREAAELTGLKAGIPVVAGAGDNAAAAVGTGVVSEGKAFTTIGTSGVIFAHSDKVVIDKRCRVHSFCAAVPGGWTVMSCTLAAGFSLKWLRDNFFTSEKEAAAGLGDDPYVIMDNQAKKIPIGANKLIFLPYLMGERSPILDEHSRGVFFGLSGIHNKYDMLRAVMEGVVYSQRECIDVFREMGIKPEEMLATGGGGTSSLWRQMLADNYGHPVKTIHSKEGPALGAAILAGVGAGIYKTVESGCNSIIKVKDTQTPIAVNTEKYNEYYKVYRSLYPSIKEQFRLLGGIKED